MDLKYINSEDREALRNRTWSLVAMYSDGSGSGIDVVRSVDDAEASSLIDATRLMSYFCETVNWDQLGAHGHQLLGQAADILKQETVGGATSDVRSALNLSVREFLGQLRNFYGALLRGQRYIDAESEDGGIYLDVLDQLSLKSRLDRVNELFGRDLDTWAELVEAPGVRTTQIPVFSATVADKLQVQSHHGRRLLVREYVANTIAEAEVILSRLLRGSQTAIVAASRSLINVQADVLFGAPALVDRDGLARRPVVVEALPIDVDKVRRVNNALHSAQRVLERRVRGNEGTDDESPEQEAFGESTSEASEARGSATADGAQPDQTDSGAQESNAESGAGSRTDSAGERPAEFFPAADITSMAYAFRQLSPRIERKWSEALSYAINQSDINIELARWGAVLRSIYAKLQLRSGELNIPKFPLDDSDLGELNGAARGQRRIWQDEVATMYAVKALADSVALLAEPPQMELKFSDGKTAISRWWAAGAFSLVVSAADLVIRHLESIGKAGPGDRGAEHLDPAETAISPSAAVSSVDRYLQLGKKCLDEGMPEGALLYFRLGCREAGFVSDTVSAVERSLTEYLDGSPPELGFAVCLANIAYRTELELAANPPGTGVDA